LLYLLYLLHLTKVGDLDFGKPEFNTNYDS
jgi:hypothetical protein